EGEVEADTRYSSAWVRMKDSTIISRRRGAGTEPATMADLQPGTRVEVKFAGVVAQLDPVQATAAEITIIDWRRGMLAGRKNDQAGRWVPPVYPPRALVPLAGPDGPRRRAPRPPLGFPLVGRFHACSGNGSGLRRP